MKEMHFVTGAFIARQTHLSEEDYAKVLDCVVIACVDCLLVHDAHMLLGKRTREPHPDWWLVGGRMLPGESFADAALRNLKRELALTVEDASRFEFLGVSSLVWGKRAQARQEHGCHTIAVTLTLKITARERALIQPNDEYAALQWLTPEHVRSDPKYHPLIREIAGKLLTS